VHKLAVGHRPEHGHVILQDSDVKTVGVLVHVPIKNLEQGTRVTGSGNFRELRRRRRDGRRRDRMWSRLSERVEEIANRFGVANNLKRQPHAKGALDTENELGAPEAIDAQIALQPARKRDAVKLHPLRVQLAGQLADEVE
jgi:hypothetical protein